MKNQLDGINIKTLPNEKLIHMLIYLANKDDEEIKL